MNQMVMAFILVSAAALYVCPRLVHKTHWQFRTRAIAPAAHKSHLALLSLIDLFCVTTCTCPLSAAVWLSSLFACSPPY